MIGVLVHGEHGGRRGSVGIRLHVVSRRPPILDDVPGPIVIASLAEAHGGLFAVVNLRAIDSLGASISCELRRGLHVNHRHEIQAVMFVIDIHTEDFLIDGLVGRQEVSRSRADRLMRFVTRLEAQLVAGNTRPKAQTGVVRIVNLLECHHVPHI